MDRGSGRPKGPTLEGGPTAKEEPMPLPFTRPVVLFFASVRSSDGSDGDDDSDCDGGGFRDSKAFFSARANDKNDVTGPAAVVGPVTGEESEESTKPSFSDSDSILVVLPAAEEGRYGESDGFDGFNFFL